MRSFHLTTTRQHTVKAGNLEPNTEYVYRVGLGYGQGIKWSDSYYEFRSSLPVGPDPNPSPDKPAITFLALADQGCSGSFFNQPQGNDPPRGSPDAAKNVTDLITSMVNNQTIHSVHIMGDLAYADGAAHVWDMWTEMIQAYASKVPVMVGVGNHEYDHTEGGEGGKDPSGEMSAFGFQPSWGEGAFQSKGGECGVPVSKRFAVPDNGNGMNGVFWYVQFCSSPQRVLQSMSLTSFLSCSCVMSKQVFI